MAHLNQIAFSVTDLRRTWAWYRDVLGLVPAGGTEAFKGYLAEKVQGVQGARSTCWWLIDSQDFFQLEFFEFSRPAVRPLPADRRLCDIGYGMVGFYVADFDAVMTRLAERDTAMLTEVMGDPGDRRVCLKDPEGVLLELMEADPLAPAVPARAGVSVTARSITVSVADLVQSRGFFVDVLGLAEPEGLVLHGEEHERLWGLEGAKRRSVLLRAGGVLVELVQYTDPPGQPRPADYRISDQGVLNIALGFRQRAEFERVYRRCREAGVEGNWRPLRLGAWSVVYVNDQQGFSVELLHVQPWYDRRMGFRPALPPAYHRRDEMKTWRTAIITGGCSGIGFTLARKLLEEGTSVAVIDRNSPDQARETLDAAARRVPGTRLEFFQADVCDEAGLAGAVGEAVTAIGAPELVVNCAGIQNAKPFGELTGPEFERVVSVNLFGSRNLASAVLPTMRSGSQLALVASLAGLVPSHSYAAYNASKYGVVGLAGALRLEYIAQGIEVSVVCPPEVNTPMVVEERKTLPPVAVKLKEAAGTLEVEPASDAILKQLRARRALVIPGFRARAVALIARLFPGLMRRISERIVRATV